MKCQFNDCGANALKGGEFCFTHDPLSKDKHLEAASKGGSVSRDLGSVVLAAVPLKRTSHIVELLEETINRVRIIKGDGTMDIRVANCIGYLAGQLIKAIEVSDIATRLEVVEQIILKRKSISRK